MLAVNIDDDGFYIPGSEYEDLLHDGIPQPPNGFYRPKWVNDEWVEGMLNPPFHSAESQNPDWIGLLNEVRATPVFAKVYAASKLSLPVNVAYTLLLSTLTSHEPHINDLTFALHDLKANMLNLSASDIKFINQVLEKYHFPISV